MSAVMNREVFEWEPLISGPLDDQRGDAIEGGPRHRAIGVVARRKNAF
jgi:hypothetical protein